MELQITAVKIDLDWEQEIRTRNPLEVFMLNKAPWQKFPQMWCFPPSAVCNNNLLGQDIYVVHEEASLGKKILNFLRGRDRKKPKELRQFSKLPVELQIKIFELALPGPRTILGDVKDLDDTLQNLKYHLIVHPIATPLLHVNRVAREIALERYTRVNLDDRQRSFYISWKDDTIYFDDGVKLAAFFGYFLAPSVATLSTRIRSRVENIQHLTFEYRKPWCMRLPLEIGNVLVDMPNLKSITLARCEWSIAVADFYPKYITVPMYALELLMLRAWVAKWKSSAELKAFVDEIENRKKLFGEKFKALINNLALDDRGKFEGRVQIDMEVEAERVDSVALPVVILGSKGVLFTKACVEIVKKENRSLHNTSFTFAPIKRE